MKKLNILILIAITASLLSCTDGSKVDIGEFKNIEAKERTIQVTGSAEMSIIPDQIELLIEIREYYEEEFQEGKKWEDYKTLVPFRKIESQLQYVLKKQGIKKSQITIKDVGNYWRCRGKQMQMSKLYSIQLENLEQINEIISMIDFKGVDYIRIGELKHKDYEQYRKQVKTEALAAAKAKAEYLLSSLDKEVGEIISIIEINNNTNNWWFNNRDSYSNTLMSSGQRNEGESPRQIKLRFEIETTFEIKQ